jgi:hypothetical protein
MSTIAGWLEGLGFAHYVSIFAEHAVDIDVLFELTEADLERLGLPLGDRKRMLASEPVPPGVTRCSWVLRSHRRGAGLESAPTALGIKLPKQYSVRSHPCGDQSERAQTLRAAANLPK